MDFSVHKKKENQILLWKNVRYVVPNITKPNLMDVNRISKCLKKNPSFSMNVEDSIPVFFFFWNI